MLRYHLHNHPAFPGLLSKDDLRVLVERGSLARGDLCKDVQTGRDHTLGELLGTWSARSVAGARISRPAYQEFRADTPGLAAADEDLLAPDREASDADAEHDPDQDDVDNEDTDPDATLGREQVVYHAHPSWLTYSKALFLALLLAIAAGLLFVVAVEYCLLGVAASVFTLIATALVRQRRHYYITEERVEVVWGVIGRNSKEVRICDIRSIDVYEPGLKGLLGLGTLDFSSAANSGIEVQFKDVRHAHHVKQQVRRLQKSSQQD